MDARVRAASAAIAIDAPSLRNLAQLASAAPRARLDNIDFLRGLIMVIMLLDHARDYLSGGSLNPRDVHDSALFLTRWVTHFCAPLFILLAGVSAFLYGARGRSTSEIARFLASRGLWLILIEVTLVRLGWTFNLDYSFVFFQVIWVIGCSMIALAGLVFLPRWAVATFAAMIIFGHHLLDRVEAADLGGTIEGLWTFMHAPGFVHPSPGAQWLVLYPLIPWVGVMAAGYVLGPVMLWDEARRRKTLLTIGVAAVLAFIMLRATNFYGDPAPWTIQHGFLPTLLSFINCEKYPPSVLYLLMTLGPGLIILAMFRRARSTLAQAIITIGRVPFLFYVAHIYLVHAMAIVVSWLSLGHIEWLFVSVPVGEKPEGYGLPLIGVYACWLLALLILYPLCRWFADVKRHRKDWWLSYL